MNGKYLFHHTIHSSSEDFLLFLIFSLLSTSQFLYYFQCCVVFSVGTICVLQYDVLYWLVWYCLSGVAKCIRFMFGSPGLLSLHFNVWRWYLWDETHPYYIFHMTLLMKLFEFNNFFFFPFSIKHIFCIPSLNFLCSQMLMWSKVSCKQPWSRIMCNPTF